MQRTETPESNRTAEVEPAIRHTVPWRVTSVAALPAFGHARVVLGAVQWPNGADLAPDAMYDAIRQYGLWVLD